MNNEQLAIGMSMLSEFNLPIAYCQLSISTFIHYLIKKYDT